MIELFSYSLNHADLFLVLVVAILIGMGKTGVAGSGMIAVPLLAIVFGGKESTGVMLPILIFADVFAVWKYNQHASWEHLRRLLPFALIGVIIGTYLGNVIDGASFRYLMAFIIFFCLAIMIWQEATDEINVPTSPWFARSIGIVGGIATMVGNLAGPVMILYLLAMRFPKNRFIGTAAWFFFVINLAKVPFHVLVWETIDLNTLGLTTLLIPAIGLGAFLGIVIVRVIPEKIYRRLVILMTAIAALALLN